MKTSDLTRAQKLLDDRSKDQSIMDRMAAGERMRLTIGTGVDESEIVLTPAYLAQIKSDIASALNQRITATGEALQSLGVEP
jgi:hypothetical protein